MSVESLIILGVAKEARLHVVSLEAPGNRPDDLIVKAGAQCPGERSIAGLHKIVSHGRVLAGGDVRDAKQSLRKRTKFPDAG